jgi:hypothetical protein
MELNPLKPLIALDALPMLLDLVEILARKLASAQLTPMEMALSMPVAPHAIMVPLTHKLLPNHTQLLTASVKPTTTLMELLANAQNAVLVIRQLVERKLQQHQRKLGVIFAIRATMEQQLQLQLVLVDVNNAPPKQSLLRNHHRLPQ